MKSIAPDRDEPGAIYTVRAPVTVRAVQLTADADWPAIAAWCGGWLVNPTAVPGDLQLGLVVGSLSHPVGRLGDWVVRGIFGQFFIRTAARFAADYAPGQCP